MSYDIYLAHLALCLIFFLILSWLGVHSYSYGYRHLSILYTQDEAPLFNLTFRMAAPLVYLVLASAVFYAIGLDRYVQNIFMVTVYYFAFRILFNVAMGYRRLLNWPREVFLAAFAILASKIIYQKLIVSKTFLFPNTANIANEMWIGIIVFIYSIGNKVRTSGDRSKRRKADYLLAKYAEFHRKYDSIISPAAKNPHIVALIYAILIFENFNRPRIIRAMERFVLPLSGPRTIGVMQFRTTKNISDEESVRLGAKKIVDDWELGIRKDLPAIVEKHSGEKDIGRRQRLAKYEVFRGVIAKYNGGSTYESEIGYLYGDILKRFYPNVKRSIAEYWSVP